MCLFNRSDLKTHRQPTTAGKLQRRRNNKSTVAIDTNQNGYSGMAMKIQRLLDLLALLYSFEAGGVYPCVAGVVLGWLNNDFRFAKRSCIGKDAVGSIGAKLQ